tara:strand:- start:1266 stop:1430 length:165 start_codon:yes stop_codon:yes gene_type:complete
MSKQPQAKIRFCDENLLAWLKSQAALNHRTMNAEINFHLEQAMLKQQKESSNVK